MQSLKSCFLSSAEWRKIHDTNSKSMGRPSSDRHREWKIAIERREAIAELEQQIKMLDALIERQLQAFQLQAFLTSL